MKKVPFVKVHYTGKEAHYIEGLSTLSGDGHYTHACHRLLEQLTGSHKVLLTHSCTAALEMAALLFDIQPGDEIIMPSYTFVSTANAFALRGGVPVFVDVREDTLNLDESLIEAAITERTRAIVPVHYAGVACEMDAILAIAKKYGLYVLEDAAQGILSTYHGKALGTFGHLGAYSFHETKNVVSGEGGALLINDEQFSTLAEIIREKGTDRSRFFRGEIDKYTWQHLGSSFLPSELVAAFLLAQLESVQSITARRLKIWDHYHAELEVLEQEGLIRRPKALRFCKHNAHMYYLLLPDLGMRNRVISHLRAKGVHAVFHYAPLHLSPGGLRYARAQGPLPVTESIADRILRLPLYADMSQEEVAQVVSAVKAPIFSEETVACAP